MSDREPRLLVQSSPYLRPEVTTPRIMGDVLIALVPALAAAVWLFGISALLVIVTATLTAMATEWIFTRGSRRMTLADGSAAVTGVILGLTMPPSFPLWMAALGGFVSIALGKLAFGGLGHNLFNPALVGRAFLQAAFPIAITTWVPPQGPLSLYRGNFAIPFLQAPPDAVTTASPLNLMKFEGLISSPDTLFLGGIPGSLGETSALAILLGGLYLLARRAFDWRIPAGILLSVAGLSGVLHLMAPERYPDPLFMLLSGGLLFGTVYMATDPVTSPIAPQGAWIFGIGVGLLVVLIRLWGGLPEGVMYAILFMNAATPLLERVTQPRAFGHGRAPA